MTKIITICFILFLSLSVSAQKVYSYWLNVEYPVNTGLFTKEFNNSEVEYIYSTLAYNYCDVTNNTPPMGPGWLFVGKFNQAYEVPTLYYSEQWVENSLRTIQEIKPITAGN